MPSPPQRPILDLPRAILLPVAVALAATGVAVAWAAVTAVPHAGRLLPMFGVLVAGLLITWLTVRRCLRRQVLRPLGQLAETMDRCTIDGDACRVPQQASRELDLVASTLNLTLDRMVRNEAKTRSVIESAADGIVTINRRGIIQSFNPAAERMFGYAADAVIGRNVSLLMPEPHRGRHDEYLQRHLQTGIERVMGFAREETAVRADGTVFPISLNVTRVDSSDEPMFCGVIRDITEEKQAERDVMLYTTQIEQANVQLAEAKFQAEQAMQLAETANQSKSEFLANMSHEIRTPMTAILGYAENLQDPHLGAEERQAAVTTILRNGEHLMTLINDILDLSKIEAGKLTVENIACSPVALLADVASLMRVRAEAKRLRLEVEYQCPLPAEICTDPTRLRQILINLCGNAIKFTELGSVTMRLSLQSGTHDNSLLLFEIRDTGIGMTEEHLRRLFLPFEQADSSTTRRFGGSGLGLSISRRLVEMLGGSVAVHSEPGRGSTFQFTVATGPLRGVPMLYGVTEALSSRRAARSRERVGAERLHGRLLLAEDGPDNQRLISFLLKRAGADVVIAANGRSAVDLALQADASGQPFDLILMDMQMPVMDGYQAARELRDAGFQRPIVALTANAMAGDRERCLASGCDEFASKPIDRRILVQTIARLLRQGGPEPS